MAFVPFAVATTLPRSASAETPSDKLDYEAPTSCPSRAEFEEQVRARVASGWATGSDTRHFDVRIVRDARGVYVGTLTVRGAGREPNEREIRASTCRAVSTSLAVFMAIALAPTGTEEPPTSNEPHGAPEPEMPTSTSTTPPPPSTPSSTKPPRSPASTATPRAPTARWFIGSGFRATYLHAPEAAWGGRVFMDVRRMPARGGLGAEARLSWGWTDFTEHPPLSGDVNFRLRTARVEGCPRWEMGDFALSPCAGLDLGSLTGDTPRLRRATSTTAFWSGATGTIRGGLAVTPWLSLELEATLLVPFVRPRFEVGEPLRTVYRPPAVLFEAGAGACLSGRFH